MKRIFSVLMCAVLCVLTFTGCQNHESTQETTAASPGETQAQGESKIPSSKRPVTLGYYADETLNPFKTEITSNRNAASLLYDSLFILDSSYKPIEAVAEGFLIDGKELTVTLKNPISFTDGSSLSAEDVIYSFGLARKSPFFSARLKGFSGAAYGDSRTVIFKMKEENVFAAACLDFPLVKHGTGENAVPVGSGRYIFKKKKGVPVLVRNENYSLNEEMEQKEIRLLDLTKAENELYMLQIGELTSFFDESGKFESIKISASTAEVSENSLVFLGFNSQSGPFAENELKKAAAAAIDKTALAGSVYRSLAKPCSSPFNPDWYALFEPEQKESRTSAAEILEKAGYIYAYPENKFRSKNFEFLTVKMIAGEEDEGRAAAADFAANSLIEAGFDVRLEKLPYDEYVKRLSDGDFDLYIGETKLTPDMELSVFFSKDGAACFAAADESTAAGAYYDLKSGKIDMRTFCGVFDEYLPFLPLCCRMGTVYYSRELKYEGFVNENNIFKNIYSWET